MTDEDSGEFSLGFWLSRLAPLAAFAVLTSGFFVAALERFRPEIFAGYQNRIFSASSALFFPVRQGTCAVVKQGRQVGDLWQAADRGAGLEREVTRLRAELQASQEEVRRLGRVSGLRQWRSAEGLEFVPADVVGFSSEDQSSLLTINRGARDGLWDGLPVVGRNGLAGIIREAAPSTSSVQALTDPLSAVGVADLQTRRRGVVFGRGRDQPPEFIPETEVQPVNPGSILITSGFGNSIYPKGLIVGRVKERRTNKRGLVYGVIEPAEPVGQLEEVLVIRPGERLSEEGGTLGTLSVEMPTSPTLQTALPTTVTIQTALPTTTTRETATPTTDTLQTVPPAAPPP